MARLDATVKKETLYIAAWTAVLSGIMQSVYLIVGIWHIGALLANVLSGAASVFNFLLMGISVSKALGKDEKDASQLMRFSQSMRMFMMLACAALGVIFFDPAAALIPLFFPGIAIFLRPLFNKRSGEDDSDQKGGESTK